MKDGITFVESSPERGGDIRTTTAIALSLALVDKIGSSWDGILSSAHNINRMPLDHRLSENWRRIPVIEFKKLSEALTDQESHPQVVVMFIDMTDSTALKEKTTEANWLNTYS